MLQCSEPTGEKHATDTLPMPVTSLGFQCLGDKRSVSCLGATASLSRQEQPFALPSRKATFHLKGNAGISLWEYPGDYLSSTWVDSATAGLPPSPKAPLSHGEVCCVHRAKRRVTDNPSKRRPENGRRAELLLSCALPGWPLHFSPTLGRPGSSREQWPACHSRGRVREGHPTRDYGWVEPAEREEGRWAEPGLVASPGRVRHLVPAPLSGEWETAQRRAGQSRHGEPSSERVPSSGARATGAKAGLASYTGAWGPQRKLKHSLRWN